MIAIVAFMAPTASQVVADVQAHYARLPQLTMDFDQKVTTAVINKTATSHGTMYVLKPDRFRLDYVKVVNGKSKFEKSFIFDGADLWLVDHMNLTVTKMAAAGSQLPAIASFLTNPNLAQAYTISLADKKLVLVPKQPSASVKELDFVVDLQTWDVTESIVVAPNGNIEDFTFSKTTTALIPPNTFVFNPKSLPTYKLTVVPAAAPAPAPAPAKPAPAAAPAKKTP